MKPKRAYLCGTALHWELGETDTKTYTRKLALEQTCAQECGVAEVEVRFVRWVKKPKPFKPTPRKKR